MAKSLAEELKITHSATIVYHLYDISVYFSSSAAHGKRIKNYTTICNSSLIGLDVYESKKELPDWWGSGPVHMTPTGYAKIAESIVEQQGVDSNKKEGAVKPLETVKKSDTVAGRWNREGDRQSGQNAPEATLAEDRTSGKGPRPRGGHRAHPVVDTRPTLISRFM